MTDDDDGNNGNRPGPPPNREEPSNRRALFNLALTLVIAMVLGSASPEPLRAAAVGSFLFFAAIGVSLVALFRKEKAFQPKLTRWDVAAILYLLSMTSNLFVDQEAVMQILEQMRDGTYQP